MLKALTLTPLLAVPLVLLLLLARNSGRRLGPAHSPFLAGAIQCDAIRESSGVVSSRRHPGVFWTLNDSGNAPVIYAITRDGRLLGQFRVDAINDDWEDIAVDDNGNLLIGNTGNNKGRRQSIQVLCVQEPDPRAARGNGLLPVKQSWALDYPDAPFDCESLFVHGDRGYVISKVFKRRRAWLYSFSLKAAQERQTLQAVAELPLQWPATAADLSLDGRRLAVVTTKGLHVFARDETLPWTRLREIQRFPLDPRQNIEGCCFAEGGVLATAETRNLYFFPPPGAGKPAYLPANQR